MQKTTTDHKEGTYGNGSSTSKVGLEGQLASFGVMRSGSSPASEEHCETRCKTRARMFCAPQSRRVEQRPI